MRGRFLILLLLLALTGCSDRAGLEAEIEIGKGLIKDLQDRKLDALEAQLDRTKVGDSARATLTKMAELLPADAPTEVDVARIGVKKVVWSGKPPERYVALEMQYRFGDKWFLITAFWRKPDIGPLVIEGLHIFPLRASLREVHRFALGGKGPMHYAMLGLVLALPVFTLVTLVLCIRTPMRLWRKALWIVAILFGLTTLHFNWTTGAALWEPGRFLLGSAAFRKPELGPLVLSISLPLGAIVFVWRRRSLLGSAGEDRVPAAVG